MRNRSALASVVAVLFAALAGASTATQAQKYPFKTVRIVCAYPAGSTTDIVSRMLANKLQASLGQPVVVENQSGASGNLATANVARAAPDGYTLVVSAGGPMAINKAVFRDLPYDPEKDLAPVSLLISTPYLIVTSAPVPVKTFAEFIAHVRANPGKLAYASIGAGTGGHIVQELLNHEQKLSLVHVPYRGWNQALLDVAGGAIQTMIGVTPALLPQVRAGKLRALALTSPVRRDFAPDVPTTAELGMPQLETTGWFGLAAPGGTPGEVLGMLGTHTVQAMQSPDVRDTLVRQGYDVVAAGPQPFAALIRSEIARWTPVVNQLGIKPN